MSKSKADLKARAAKAAQRPTRTAESKPTETPPKRAAPTPRAKPVRVTTDLDPQRYRELLTYSADLAENLGRARVPHTEVIRALIDQLQTDPALQSSIADSVAARLSK